METVMAYLAAGFDAFSRMFWSLLSQPFDPDDRLYWLYVCCSLFFVYGVYYYKSKARADTERSMAQFWSFMFPHRVWRNPSAWLDVRFYIINHFTGRLVYAGLLGLSVGLSFEAISGDSFADVLRATTMPTWTDLGISILFLVTVTTLSDFTAFFIHYLQHKIPFLWEFHKVHHSPEVMHPLSNFREHPFDNVLYTLAIGAMFGAVFAAFGIVLGYLPNMPALFGVPLLVFLFNAGGYHLRHSHVWLRWPGKWSMVFPSPAHHHVHHSRHPDHLDKNFAFLFPVWDVIFRTYHMPDDERDVEFGIHGAQVQEYDSILKLYFLPFSKLYNGWKGRDRRPVPPIKTKQDETR